MATYTNYKSLEKPLSTEKYNVAVANKNNDVIDSELHKLDVKNQSQDELLATKESLNSEITRATNKENNIVSNLTSEIARAKSAENSNTKKISDEITRALSSERNIELSLQEHILDENAHHAHNNKSTLDKLNESDNGTLLFNGQEINCGNENNENANNSFWVGVYELNISRPINFYFSNLLKTYLEDSSIRNNCVMSAIMKIEVYSMSTINIQTDMGFAGTTGVKNHIDSYLYLCDVKSEIFQDTSGYERVRCRTILKAIGDSLQTQYGAITSFSYAIDAYAGSTFENFGIICSPATGYLFNVNIIPLNC